MPGPLPNPNARRRNQPTKPSSDLPRGGRRGAVPKCPYSLGDAGKAWWVWAWRLPQAVKWDEGSLYFVARRAQLEDAHAEELKGTVLKEMRELDNRLGLNPKAMGELRWSIAGEPESERAGLAVVTPIEIQAAKSA